MELSRQRTPPAPAPKATVPPMNVPWEARPAFAAHRADAGRQSAPLAAGHQVASRGAVQTVSVIMPTVSWSGTFATCGPRVLELIDAASCAVEFIVAYDGTVLDVPEWLERPDVRVVATGGPFGPSIARNQAVDAARGDVLFFVDADVELADDAIERVHSSFAADPGLVGLFGAYDDTPAAEGLVSQFRNLLHHHTHIAHPGRAGTFWAGCGAMRTVNFMDIGGFDDHFENPSVEDIALGMRVRAEGGRIMLDPLLQCKHHKRWTITSMVSTDIFCRAVPWTHLILQSRRLPDTLNIDWRNRASGVLSVAAVAAGVAAAFAAVGAVSFTPQVALLGAVGCLAGLLALNLDFYLLCLRQGGPLFAVGSFALHGLYFFYSSLTFGAVVLHAWIFGPSLRRPTVAEAAAGRPAPQSATKPLG